LGHVKCIKFNTNFLTMWIKLRNICRKSLINRTKRSVRDSRSGTIRIRTCPTFNVLLGAAYKFSITVYHNSPRLRLGSTIALQSRRRRDRRGEIGSPIENFPEPTGPLSFSRKTDRRRAIESMVVESDGGDATVCLGAADVFLGRHPRISYANSAGVPHNADCRAVVKNVCCILAAGNFAASVGRKIALARAVLFLFLFFFFYSVRPRGLH